MPSTPVYGIPYENPDSDQPGITLHGGMPPSSPLSAEVIEAVLVGQATDVVDLDTRLAAVETAVAAMRWRHITEGSGSAGSNDHVLTVPAGYKMLRLFTWGDITAGGEDILLRVNGDAGSNHNWGLNIHAADGTTTSYTYNAGSNFWRIGRWSTVESGSSVVHIFPTDGTANPAYVAMAERPSTSAISHQVEFGYGKYLGDVVVSTLQLSANTTTFASVHWVLEGYLA